MTEGLFSFTDANMLESCGNCRFFKGFYGPETVGECRRYPPRIIDHGYLRTTYESLPEAIDMGTRFPSVDPTDWCGEFQFNADTLSPPGNIG